MGKYGKVPCIRALVSYEGSTAQELIVDFHGAVDDYLELCAQQGKEPERVYKREFYGQYIQPYVRKKYRGCPHRQ